MKKRILLLVIVVSMLATVMIIPSFAAGSSVQLPYYLIRGNSAFEYTETFANLVKGTGMSDRTYNGKFYMTLQSDDGTTYTVSSEDETASSQDNEVLFIVREGVSYYEVGVAFEGTEQLVLQFEFDTYEYSSVVYYPTGVSGNSVGVSNFTLYYSVNEKAEFHCDLWNAIGAVGSLVEWEQVDNEISLPRYILTVDSEMKFPYEGPSAYVIGDVHIRLVGENGYIYTVNCGDLALESSEDRIYIYTGAEDNTIDVNFSGDDRELDNMYVYLNTEQASWNGRVTSFEIFYSMDEDGAEEFSEIAKGYGLIVIEEDGDTPLDLIGMMFGNFGASVVGFANGIKESVSGLIWDVAADGTKELSDFAIFIFTIAGLAIAMVVFWLIFRLIRFGRQR